MLYMVVTTRNGLIRTWTQLDRKNAALLFGAYDGRFGPLLDEWEKNASVTSVYEELSSMLSST